MSCSEQKNIFEIIWFLLFKFIPVMLFGEWDVYFHVCLCDIIQGINSSLHMHVQPQWTQLQPWQDECSKMWLLYLFNHCYKKAKSLNYSKM